MISVVGLDPSLTHTAGFHALGQRIQETSVLPGISLRDTVSRKENAANLPPVPVTDPSALELRGFSIKSKPDQHAHCIARLRYLRDALAAELDTCARDLFGETPEKLKREPGLLMIEGYAYGAKCSREALGELGGVYRMLAHERGWTIVVVPPSVLKLYVTGKGTAPKELMMLHVFKRWGYSAPDNNAADAHALMRLGVAYLGGREDIPKRDAHVLGKLEALAAA